MAGTPTREAPHGASSAAATDAARERRRKLRQLDLEYQRKRLELGLDSPRAAGLLRKGPRFYFIVMILLALIGMLVIKATNRREEQIVRQEGNPMARAILSIDALAQALGRYHHDTGSWPSRTQGIEALAWVPESSRVPGWKGPYIRRAHYDFWGMPYRYRPPLREGELPALSSCGPDRLEGTDDDLLPNPERFVPDADWVLRRTTR